MNNLNKPKFTEGPWSISDVTINGVHVEGSWAVSCGGCLLAEVTSGATFGIIDEIQRANAQLIKSAPLLYKSLHDMCYDYRHKHGLDGAYDAVLLQAEAALKEATNVK